MTLSIFCWLNLSPQQEFLLVHVCFCGKRCDLSKICRRHSSARISLMQPLQWHRCLQSCLFLKRLAPLSVFLMVPHFSAAFRIYKAVLHPQLWFSVRQMKHACMSCCSPWKKEERSLTGSLQQKVCFQWALHSVDPKSSPGVLPMQGHSCSFIWWPDKFRSRPAGDPMCLSILQSTMFNACSC